MFDFNYTLTTSKQAQVKHIVDCVKSHTTYMYMICT